MTMTQGNQYLDNIVRLQLKKPKSWNWQLSTSKSSPHIALPIIQLYDAKGRLLLETKDNGNSERQSWHSLDVQFKESPTNVRREFRDSTGTHLQRCRSDTLPHNSNKSPLQNKCDSTRRKDKNRSNNKLIKSSSAVLEKLRKNAAVLDENRKARCYDENAISGKLQEKRKPNHLRKSKSDVLEMKDNSSSSSLNSENMKCNFLLNPSRSLAQVEPGKVRTTRRHQRSRSDDLFRRKLKYNSEESIKRAESDGYRNFITPNISSDKSPTRKPQRNKMTAENVLFGNNASRIEVNHFKHNRYTTRTSSAGTLIIREESFNLHRRRRSKPENAVIETPKFSGETLSPCKQDIVGESLKDIPQHKRMYGGKHIRQTSDPTGAKFQQRYLTTKGKNQYDAGGGCPETDMPDSARFAGVKEISSNNPQTDLSNPRKELFLFEDAHNDKDDAKCDYVVQEPTTTPNESRKSSGPVECCENPGQINEKTKRKKRKKLRRRTSDGSTSSGECRNKNNRTGHLVKEHTKLNNKTENGDTDLLQLVRRLSSNDHVKMGANVSRHSAKGLSGRRSQSSGSICNGKGRHADGKICSSLPSYLDERDGQGCNNNHHDCEKPPIDEVERIPPLGDGAPLHWKFSDNQTVLCDQGYGSERSPEEEYPPPLPDHENQCHHHLEPHACYPFITPESTFIVKLTKGSRGLGLSVTGGVDSTGAWPGLIRIKRLFPHQPASTCGHLNVGDLLIEANGITLTGLTNYEALEVLRTAPNQVELKVCRPPPDVLNCVSPISEVPPPPPRREPPTSLNLPSAAYCSPEDDYYHGEFEVTLTKIQGSLGFTLRKEDDSALGHYVRALVREPALTDGRIRAGDKIIAVNEVEISPMSHEQAVQFLRQCGDVVKLRLYRDSAQTPVAALSPTETTPRTSFSRKAHLRQEAVDMLNDIAVRKLIPGNQDTYRRSLSPNASPRRLRRHPCPSDASQITDSSTYMQNDEQFHEGLLQKCSNPYDDDAFNSLFSIESDDGDRPSRPSSLDLYNPNQTPVAARKPRFNFSLAHNQYELNNLDPEVLDAPNLTYNLGNDDAKSADVESGDSFPQEPASMPHIPLDTPAFSYKNPAYQSAHPQCGAEITTEEKSNQSSKPNAAPKPKTTDDTNMKKWKGIVFDKEDNKPETRRMKMPEEYEVLAIELNRGWNSRLGFSLQGAAGVTYVSAVHADSVAAKDGRLKPGDRVIKVNDESVENMTTNEIIDLLRIVRGPVCIVISRVKSNEDCSKSNAKN